MTAKRRPRVVMVSDFPTLFEELEKGEGVKPDILVFEDRGSPFPLYGFDGRVQALIGAHDYARFKRVNLWCVVPTRASVSTSLLATGVKIVVGSEIRSAIQWWPEYERLSAAQRKKEIAHMRARPKSEIGGKA